MAGIDIITDRIIFLGILVLTGYISTLLKYTKPSIGDGISLCLTNLTIPALVLSSFSTIDMNANRLKSGLFVLIASYALIFILIGLGKIFSKALKLKGVTASAHTYLTACGNVTFMGYPIISAVLGNEGLYYAMLYMLANNTVIWILSIYSILKCHGKKSGNLALKLLNPSSISLILGFAIMVFDINIPSFLLKPMEALGECTTPMSMIFIGITLATIKFSKFLNIWKGLIIVLVKMIVVPIILILALPLFNYYDVMSHIAISSVILQCAMPSTSIYAVLSKTYGGDYEYAAQNILITTVCSFFTIPFIYYLLTAWGNF